MPSTPNKQVKKRRRPATVSATVSIAPSSELEGITLADIADATKIAKRQMEPSVSLINKTNR